MFLSYLFFLHFVSDFLLQTRWMAINKSKDYLILLAHVLLIWLVFVGGLLILFPGPEIAKTFLFATLNSAIHAVIDWNIWKGYKLLVWWRNPMATPETWRYWEDHWFYATIGLDQMLHGITIILLAEWLLK